MLAYIPVEHSYLVTLSKMSIFPARQNHFVQENIFTKRQFVELPWQSTQNLPSLDRILKYHSGVSNSNSEKLEHSDEGSIVEFDAAEKCCLYVMTMKTMNLRDDILSIDVFKDHHVLVFDLTSMQVAIENSHYPELVGEPLRLKLKITFPLEHVTELLVMVNQCLWLQLTSLVLLEKISTSDNVSLEQIINRVLTLNYPYLGSFASVYVPTFDNDTFAIINTQPSKKQGEHWVMVAKFCQNMYFSVFLGREKYCFLQKLCKQMMPAQLQSRPSVCGLYTVYAAFYFLKFCQEGNIWVQDFTVLLNMSNYM